MAKTTFEKKCEILAGIWSNYRDEDEFEDFVENSELALRSPIAFIMTSSLKNLGLQRHLLRKRLTFRSVL